jgi:hypothetical protein
MCDEIVLAPVIHVTVPSVIVPASLSMTGASAATTTDGAGASDVTCPIALRVSPSNETALSLRSGIRAERYSRMCRAGFSNE